MIRFIIRRLIQLVFVVWVVMTVLFFFVRMSGDPALVMSGPTATPEVLEATRVRLGLDRPLHEQYVTFIGNAVSLDFGQSYTSREDALTSMLGALPASLTIAIPALLLAVTLAACIGTYAALRNGTRRGRGVMLAAWIGDATPFFVVAYLFILIFAINMGVLPAGGGNEGLRSRLLPVAAIAIPQLATLSRLVRGQLLDVLSQPYVVAARSTGMRPRQVLFQAIPNAIPPIVSYLGVMAGFFLTMLVVVEPIFSFPGFGGMLIRAVTNRDFPVVQAAIFIVAVVIISANIIADVINRLIDPQLREA